MFKSGWLECPLQWHNPQLASEFEILRTVRALTNKALSLARSEGAIRSFTEAGVAVATDSASLATLLKKYTAHSGQEFRGEGEEAGRREQEGYGDLKTASSEKNRICRAEYSLSDIFIVSSLSVMHDPSTGVEETGRREERGRSTVFEEEGEVVVGGEGCRVRVGVWRREEEGWDKCPRCWLWRRASGDQLCTRCTHVLAEPESY